MAKERYLRIFLVACFTSLFFFQAAQATDEKKTTESSDPAIKFRKTGIHLASQRLTVEVAETREGRERGLMDRTVLPEGTGMLFIFDNEETLTFWMKDTLIPLAIGYFDKNKKLIDIQEMVPASPAQLEPVLYPSLHPAKYALEVPKGWFSRHKVATGAQLKLDSDK
jgi:uncharacterized membrane protein (UPF0127 family)